MIVLNWIILLIEKLCYLKDLDNGLFEPYVLKGTRAVLRRVRGSNASILSDKGTRWVLRREGRSNPPDLSDLIFAQNEEDIRAIPDIIQPYLDDRGLILADDKTSFTNIFKGFEFLGFEVRIHKDNKCIIKPSKEFVKKAKENIRDIFKFSQGPNVETLIDKLNPVLEGITEFWKPMVSSKAFSEIDNYVWVKSWKFLKRLHHNKSSGWIVNKYFPKLDKDDVHQDRWILTDPNTGKQLNRMSWTKIERHTMIKHNYSPLDKSKSDYFLKRRLSTINIFR